MASGPASTTGAKAGEAREVAAYVASMSRDLSLLARRNGLRTLAYLLDIAHLEADSAARAAGVESSSPDVDRP